MANLDDGLTVTCSAGGYADIGAPNSSGEAPRHPFSELGDVTLLSTADWTHHLCGVVCLPIKDGEK